MRWPKVRKESLRLLAGSERLSALSLVVDFLMMIFADADPTGRRRRSFSLVPGRSSAGTAMSACGGV